MESFGTMRIETLTKDTFKTWQIQMKVLLIKNDALVYVSGLKPKSEIVEDDAKSKDDFDKWTEWTRKLKRTLYYIYRYLN